ncbi:MarR family winged helix-turn-helix transcriptional regulator [Geodermatophilus maliterrae]|uniref:MarR family winged helix-turn-helix transcriptional regulator n=1 Tax=Geodermatophilus maliterrae TaxID=3162531 RepID=A0ABV3XBT8_9ACTN
MEGVERVDLELLDDALVRLRRLWTASRAHVTDDLGRRVEMSSVLVVEACARAEADAVEVTVGDVAAFLDVEPSTASRLVERTAAAGLVRRDASTVNGRRAALRLTDAGRALRARATAARLGWLSGVVADWSAADLYLLGSALARFADAVAASPPAAGRGRGTSSQPGQDSTSGRTVQE